MRTPSPKQAQLLTYMAKYDALLDLFDGGLWMTVPGGLRAQDRTVRALRREGWIELRTVGWLVDVYVITDAGREVVKTS